MTIIDELLILLDDLEQTPAHDIPQYFESANLQVIFSSLGRLANRGWVMKKTKRDETIYSITTPGINQLNETLDAIKHEDSREWDKQWYIVVFDIPETKRKLRDMFRTILKQNGYGMLTSSVWISAWDRGDIIRRFLKRHNLTDNIYQMTTVTNNDSYQSTILAHRCWDWQKIEKSYRTFLDSAERELRELSQGTENQRFKAKKLVFQYAEVVKEDPQLPTEIAPNASIARRAHELYTKIRPYCLQEQELAEVNAAN